jgi:putative phosphoserine phosphatase/1-acylglycerol-3-phosphate O-acyltransferase
MPATAAIFDLDRTLLRTSSTTAINAALFEQGLVQRSALPGQGLMLRVYDVFGESLPSMALARAAAFASKGWRVDEVAKAAEAAADTLERLLLPYVPALLESHRAAGRALVLATTTPYQLVEPFARRLGFDDVIATHYGAATDRDGVDRMTGAIEGGFVWAVGKLQAVRKWAARAGVDLSESYAYTDSIYDLPLLMAVGHPQAVNPDYRLHAAATLRRWPVLYLDSPAGVPKLLGAEPLDVLRIAFSQVALPFARFDIAGAENIPSRGPAIVAANHRSYFDTIAYGMGVFRAGRNPRGLAKKELFDAPIIGTLMKMSGAICVDRKQSGRAAFEAAENALRSGEVLIIAPQGTIPRGEEFFDSKLRGKTGAARLAAATGAPIVPMGVWGTEHVWPRSSRVPNVVNVLSPPKVRVRIGPVVKGLTGTDFQADTDLIMEAISELLPPEAHLPRIPTAEELARTYPPGHPVPAPAKTAVRSAGKSAGRSVGKSAVKSAKSTGKSAGRSSATRSSTRSSTGSRSAKSSASTGSPKPMNNSSPKPPRTKPTEPS